MSRYLLDTSVFIALESGRDPEPLPGRLAVSVVTVGELRLGVLTARSPTVRSARAATLEEARALEPLPLTESVMDAWAQLVHDCRRAGLTRAVRANDALIAATAIVHGIPVATQDADYDAMAEAHEALEVVRV